MKKIIVLCLMAAFSFSCATEEENRSGFVKEFANTIEGEPVVPRKANWIFLGPVKNWTTQPFLADKFFFKIKESINREGRVMVVTDRDRSDLLLNVAIRDYTIQNIGFDSQGQPVKKRMKIVAEAMLMNVIKNKIIFHDPFIQAFTVYSDIVPPISNETKVMDEVIENLAKRVAAKTVTGWYTEYMSYIEKGGR